MIFLIIQQKSGQAVLNLGLADYQLIYKNDELNYVKYNKRNLITIHNLRKLYKFLVNKVLLIIVLTDYILMSIKVFRMTL